MTAMRTFHSLSRKTVHRLLLRSSARDPHDFGKTSETGT